MHLKFSDKPSSVPLHQNKPLGSFSSEWSCLPLMDTDKKPAPAVDATVCSLSDPETSQNEVDVVEDECSNGKKRKDFLRERNALYARRKYARRKIETDVLQEQCLQLEESNHYLKLEETRLRGLLEKAQTILTRYAGIPEQKPLNAVLSNLPPLSYYNPYSPSLGAIPFLGMPDALVIQQQLALQQAQVSLLQNHRLNQLLSAGPSLPLTNVLTGLPTIGHAHSNALSTPLSLDIFRAEPSRALTSNGGATGLNSSSHSSNVLASLPLLRQVEAQSLQQQQQLLLQRRMGNFESIPTDSNERPFPNDKQQQG